MLTYDIFCFTFKKENNVYLPNFHSFGRDCFFEYVVPYLEAR